MRYSISEKSNGELAVRGLSEKAEKCYDENEFGVVEIARVRTELDCSKRMYAITGAGQDDEWMTRDELEKWLEDYYDEMHADDEEDE